MKNIPRRRNRWAFDVFGSGPCSGAGANCPTNFLVHRIHGGHDQEGLPVVNAEGIRNGAWRRTARPLLERRHAEWLSRCGFLDVLKSTPPIGWHAVALCQFVTAKSVSFKKSISSD